MPASLLPAVGLATLVAVSQLTTYGGATAAATPYVMAVVAAAGVAVGWKRGARLISHRRWRSAWPLVVPVVAYLVALAPVLAAGRPSFSSYEVLTDSALHMMGADFLIHHGQSYAHLDLGNSYGQYVNSYFNSGYPSGADTLLGGSGFLLRVPLIWAFQPFMAFLLATAAGPAWVLARRIGLDRGLAALAALTVSVPALVYGYELIGSIKEIAAIPMILAMGALVALHPHWLRGRPMAAIPFAVVVAAGVSVLGIAFGAWVLAAIVVLAVVAIRDISAGRQTARQALLLLACGAIVAFVCALVTWLNASGSLQVAQSIATTTNPGNLRTPLRWTQVAGAWFVTNYRHLPRGSSLELTYAMVAITLAAGLLGFLHVIRKREHALVGWAVLTLALALGLTAYATTWASAKTLVLTSPVVMLMAWSGVAALRTSVVRLAAPLLAIALAGGVAVSDALQYHGSDLAPTGRYQEMAFLNTRFAGRGPALFTDFDEYALYQLRSLDIGGPNLMFPPVALRGVVTVHGSHVNLDRLQPTALRAYPLIITRVDPSASRPPSAYELLWQGTYYQAWGRRPGAPTAIAHLGSAGTVPIQCARLQQLAALSAAPGAQLIAAAAPQLVRIDLAAATSHEWRHNSLAFLMSQPGRLRVTFGIPRRGVWELWLKGEVMPTVRIGIDGRSVGKLSGQLSGNSHNPDTLPPLRVHLSAGRHRLSVVRGSYSLAPGDGGSALLNELFLTPAPVKRQQTLVRIPASNWRTLCGHRFDWVELVGA